MKAFKWVLGVVLLLAAVVLLGGQLIKPTFQVTRTALVNAPAERVYGLVADPRRWKDWSVWTRRDPLMKISYFGPESGAGAGWSWTSRAEGDGRMTFTAAEPPSRIAFELYFPDFGTTSRGEFGFAPEGAGTRVSWTMNGDMGRNPVLRWMTLFMDGIVGKDFDTGLSNLKALAEQA